MISLGIVTVLFNSDSVLDGFFESLHLQANQDFKVYLIDNSYTKQSKVLIESLIAKWKLEQNVYHFINDQNVGVAKGNNQGIELALQDNCQHILLANNDIEFTQTDLFDQLIITSEESKIVAPKVLYHNTNKIWYAGGHINKYKGLVIHENEFAENYPDKRCFTEYAPTCFVVFASEVFKEVGMMDEKYFVYWDDTDFILRANQKGFKVLYLPDYVIFHKVSISTGGRASLFSTYYFLRNRLYFIRKHFNGVSYLSSILYTYLTSVAKIILYDSGRKKAIIKALRDSNKM